MLTILIKKLSRDYYTIDFPFDREIVDNIKKLEKKDFLKDKKLWKLDAYNLYTLITFFNGRKDIFFEFVDIKEKPLFIEKYKKASVKIKSKEEEKAIVLNKQKKASELKLKMLSEDNVDFDYSSYLKEGIKCFKHQVVGALCSNLMESILIAADLGTGKSLLSILASEINQDIKKVLVIVPNSLKFNWGMEVSKFTNQKFYILNEKKKSSNIYTPEEAKYFIVNYEYFNSSNFDYNNRIKKYGIESPDRIIVDEAHRLKNPKAITTKNVLELFRDDVNSWLLLTGTPVPNKVTELFVPLQIISPTEFTSKSKFYTEYCGMVYNPHSFSGWVQTDKLDLNKIHQKLDALMFRVKKKDVLKDLPEIQINKIYINFTDQEEKDYKSIEDGLKTIDWSNPSLLFEKEEGTDNSVMGIMTKLRQYNSMVKLKYVKDFITELNDEENKVVTFDCYKAPLIELTNYFSKNSKFYSGEITSKDRQDIVDKFQEDNLDLMNAFITTQSGNYGITLTRSCNMIVLNQDYVPSVNSQCYARLHRIGQTNPVTIYIFIIKGSIDEDIDLLVNSKLKIIDKVVDNEDYIDESSPSIISDLINKYKLKYK